MARREVDGEVSVCVGVFGEGCVCGGGCLGSVVIGKAVGGGGGVTGEGESARRELGSVRPDKESDKSVS